jgi:hypothetical protein
VRTQGSCIILGFGRLALPAVRPATNPGVRTGALRHGRDRHTRRDRGSGADEGERQENAEDGARGGRSNKPSSR